MSERVFNFHAGPAGLPDPVMARAREEFLVFQQTGASVMEIPHRGADFMEVRSRAESLLRELMEIPAEFDILFLPGGAAGMTAAIPMNLLPENGHAAYAVTGHWSRMAAEEGKKFGEVRVVADGTADNFRRIPDAETWTRDADAAYLHYADNETIHGLEFSSPPEFPAPLVTDMTSNILSRPVRMADFGAIYASAQKNLGPSGVTAMIVRRELLRGRKDIPKVWDFAAQARRQSMVNTPPTFPIYMTALTLEWVREAGGVAEMARRAARRAETLYGFLDGTDFYRTFAAREHRSRMNVPFFLPDEELTAAFLAEAEARGLTGLKGHAVAGGCRASLYNAMPEAGVAALVEHLRDFEKRRG